MTSTQSGARNKDRAQDRNRKLDQTPRDSPVLATGKKAARQALRHFRNQAGNARRRGLVNVAGQLAGYGALLAYIWRLRRARKLGAAGGSACRPDLVHGVIQPGRTFEQHILLCC